MMVGRVVACWSGESDAQGGSPPFAMPCSVSCSVSNFAAVYGPVVTFVVGSHSTQ